MSIYPTVDERTQAVQLRVHVEYTYCPQLYIEAILDL